MVAKRTSEKERKEIQQILKDYDKRINDAKIEAKNIFNQAREKVLRDINNKKESLEKEIDKEINKAEKEIEHIFKTYYSQLDRMNLDNFLKYT